MARKQGKASEYSVIRLRRWLLAGLLVLVALLAGVLGYARYRARQLMTDLPHRLGIDIRSETNGYTYSQTIKGRTVFTIHAAKAIQRENGKATLHDVSITLYGPPGSNRTDTIRGAEFEYDQPNSVVKAMGETHLDLALPTQAGVQAKPDAKRAQVTTSGLVFLQKLGVAATDQPIHLLYGDLHGDAVGADYESDTGILRLRRDVRLDGVQNGRTVHVDAQAAEIDRTSQIATLHAAHVAAEAEQASGDTVLLEFRKDGSIETVDADGHASVRNAGGAHADAPHLRARLNAAGKVALAEMHGGVQLAAENGSGNAHDAVLHFDAAGRPVQLRLEDGARLQQARATTGVADQIAANLVDAQLMQEGARTVLRGAVATGDASFRSVTAVRQVGVQRPKNAPAAAPPTRTTVVHADTLTAETDIAGGKRYVSIVDGAGSTRVEESDTEGNQRVSTGDMLHAVLEPPGSSVAGGQQTGSLQLAVQTGHVRVMQHTAATAGKAAQDSRATADRAAFDSATQKLLLTGAPVVTAPGLQLAADRITLVQGSGDSDAQGNVRGVFVQEAGSEGKPEPIHVLADAAEMAGSGGVAHFHGTRHPARMWSSTGQLQASQIDLDRAAGTLTAHAAAGAPAHPVHLTLASAPSSSASAPSSSASAPSNSGTKGTIKARAAAPTEITGNSAEMTSATATVPGRITMNGAVQLVNGTTEVTSSTLRATLTADTKSNKARQDRNNAVSAFNQGSLETITASDHVTLRQPGRTGTGERLLYTVADDTYLLTGTPAAPPRVTDSLRGVVTGASLLFHGGDESVEVAGEHGRPVQTETNAARSPRAR